MPNFIRIQQFDQPELSGFFATSVNEVSGEILQYASGISNIVASGLANEIIYSQAVLLSGDQNISGIKNFYSRPKVNDVGVLLQGELNLSNYVTRTSGSFITRPTVNGTGVLLIGEVDSSSSLSGYIFSLVNTTSNQVISGTKTFRDSVIIDKQEGGLILTDGLDITSLEGRGKLMGQFGIDMKVQNNEIIIDREDGDSIFLKSPNILFSTVPSVSGIPLALSNGNTNPPINPAEVFNNTSPQTISGKKIFLSRPEFQSTTSGPNVGLASFTDVLEKTLFFKEIFPYEPYLLPWRPVEHRYLSVIYPEYYSQEWGRSGYAFYLMGASPRSDRPVYINDGGDWVILYDTGYFGYQNRWIVVNEEWNNSNGYQVAYVAGGESDLPHFNSWSGLRVLVQISGQTSSSSSSSSVGDGGNGGGCLGAGIGAEVFSSNFQLVSGLGYALNKIELTSKPNNVDFDGSHKTFLNTVIFKKDIILSGAYPVQNSGASLGLEMSNGIYFDDFYKSPYIKYYAGYDNTLEIRSPGGSPGALNLINGNEKIILDGDASEISYTAYAAHNFYGASVYAPGLSAENLHIRRKALNNTGVSGQSIPPYRTDGQGIMFHNDWSHTSPNYAARIYTLHDGEEFIISGKAGTPSVILITNGPQNSPTHENITIDNDDHSISLKAENIRLKSQNIDISGVTNFSNPITAPNVVYTTGSQIISGDKTFYGTLLFYNVPTSPSGLPPGAIWRDQNAGSVLRFVEPPV